MEENKNIEPEQPLQNIAEEINSTTENILPEIEVAAAEQQQTTNPKPQPLKEMEVHHHGHVHEKKKWKEYVFQFFMLFLAVFCGFLAEYQLEHVIEKDREKQYIISLVDDLKEDTRLLQSQIAMLHNKINMMDTFIAILNNPGRIPNSGNELYYYGRLAPRTANFTSNVRTFEQLKNSGNFRLIKNVEASNLIMSYYQKISPIQQLEVIYLDEFSEYKKIASRIFDPVIFSSQVSNKGEIIKTTNNPALQTNDPAMIKQLALYAVYMNGSRRTILPYDEDLLKTANELISFLQNKYHLE
jgi:hypothetical protein